MHTFIFIKCPLQWCWTFTWLYNIKIEEKSSRYLGIWCLCSYAKTKKWNKAGSSFDLFKIQSSVCLAGFSQIICQAALVSSVSFGLFKEILLLSAPSWQVLKSVCQLLCDSSRQEIVATESTSRSLFCLVAQTGNIAVWHLGQKVKTNKTKLCWTYTTGALPTCGCCSLWGSTRCL